MGVCVSVGEFVHVHAVSTEARRGRQIPRSWSLQAVVSYLT